MKHICLVILAGLFTLPFFSGCNEDEFLEICPVPFDIITDTTYDIKSKWRFVEFVNTATGDRTDPLCSAEGVILNIAGFSCTGIMIINTFSGRFSQQQGTNNIEFVDLIETRINGTEQVDMFERRFVDAIRDVDTFAINHNTLELFTANTNEMLRFVADE